MLAFAFLMADVLLLLEGGVGPGPPTKPELLAEFVWVVPTKGVMPPESKLAFPEFCCPPLIPGGANVTKGAVLLILGGANVMKGVVLLVLGGADAAVVPTTFPPDDPEGGSVTEWMVGHPQ